MNSKNYGSFNIDIANKFNLKIAVYLDVISIIYDKAKDKDLIYDDYFIVDRNYIKGKTTLSEKEQLGIDLKLKENNILEIDPADNNKIKINFSEIDKIMVPELADKPKKKTRAPRDKNLGVKIGLKSNIKAVNPELMAAYSDWIDGLFESGKGLNKTAVIEAERVVDEFSNHDLDKALEVIKIATINSYRDMSWAINSYNRSHNSFKQNSNLVFNTSQQAEVHLYGEAK